jgi:hypothetical protein
MQRRSREWSTRRAFRTRRALVVLFVLSLGYLASAYGPAYWGYLRMLIAVRAAASAAAAEPWELKPQLEQAKEAWSDQVSAAALAVGVPLVDDAISIEQVGAEAVVRAAWRVPVIYPFIGLRHTLEFQIESRQPFVQK